MGRSPRRIVLFGAAVLAAAITPGSALAHGPLRGTSTDLGVLTPGRAAVGSPQATAAQSRDVFPGPVPRADCGRGSRPETGLQGEVPLEDRKSGRSASGYECNMDQVGNYPGEGASWQMATYKDCAYYDTRLAGGQKRAGVQVIDVADRSKPSFDTNLTSISMLDPWESLAVNQERGLLAGVFAPVEGGGFFDIYDISQDCHKPVLKASLPVNFLAHEGNFSPDGRTYYSSGLSPGLITAIDVSDPARPRLLTATYVDSVIHGLELSPDGNRMYVADIGSSVLTGTLGTSPKLDPNLPNGVTVLDVSDIQARKPIPVVRKISTVRWNDGQVAQHALPFVSGGRNMLLATDELGFGGTRIVDIANERAPVVISKLKTEIQMSANRKLADRSAGYGTITGTPAFANFFGYNSHYCTLDRRVEPTIAVCSAFESGMRAFDVRDPRSPKEIAYFNPGGDKRIEPGSQRVRGTSSYTSARPHIDTEHGEVWFTDQDKGFYAVRFTNGVWPFAPKLALGRRCVSGRLRLRITGETSRVRSVAFKFGKRTVLRDKTAPFDRRVSARTLRAAGKRRIRAVVSLNGLPRQVVLARALPRCRAR